MWKNIKALILYFNKVGVPVPMAMDSASGMPSASLLFAYMSFLLAFGSVIYLLITDVLQGTLAAISLAALYFIFYMLRKLTKAKLNLTSKEIDLENDDKESK